MEAGRLMLVIPLLIFFLSPTASEDELKVRSYGQSCSEANPGVAAALISLHFHDCLVRGSRGSVLIGSTAHNTAERDSPGDNPCLGCYDVIAEAMSKLEANCAGDSDGTVKANREWDKVACCDVMIGIYEALNKAVYLNKGSIPAKKSDLIVTFREMLIDFVPSISGVSLAVAPAFKKAPGGAPANVAVGIARLGGHAAFIGKVGDDEFGHMLAGVLRENGVDDRGVLFDSRARTALAFVTLRGDGEREFMFFRNPSADMLLTEAELDRDLIKQARIFHYGSISLITEPCRSAHLAALRMAKDAGALLSYDPNLRLPLWPSPEEARKYIFSIWDNSDIIKISKDEMEFLTDGGDYENDQVIMSLMHPGLKLLILTLGGKGCRYYTKDFRGRVNSFPVNTVDTTGAGDAFVGAFLSELVKDIALLEDEKRLREVLLFSNAAGAISTTAKGAIPALPDRAAIMSLLNKIQNS